MENNEILKIYGTDYKTMTKKLLTEADLNSRIPKSVKLIGLKPNLVSAMPPSNGGTTHPEVLAGIIEYLRENGHRDIAIFEGSWVGDKTEKAVKVCGYDKLCDEYGVEFFDTKKDKSHEADCRGMRLSICDCVDKIDFLINVPVLKGHCQTRVTCALKNMKGLIPDREKRRFHTLGLHKPIAHLNTAIRQDFIVIDHICGDLDFEEGGYPVIRNCVMAAADPVLTDAYVCKLLHYDISEVPYIGMAEKLGVGSADLSGMTVRVIGENGEDQEEPLPERRIIEVNDVVEDIDSCSACYGYLIPALDMIREEGLWDRFLEKLDGGRIAIGQGYKNRSRQDFEDKALKSPIRIGIGNCARNAAINIKGCPPTEKEIYLRLKEYILDS